MCYNFKRFDEHNGICTNLRLILIDVEVITDLYEVGLFRFFVKNSSEFLKITFHRIHASTPNCTFQQRKHTHN